MTWTSLLRPLTFSAGSPPPGPLVELLAPPDSAFAASVAHAQQIALMVGYLEDPAVRAGTRIISIVDHRVDPPLILVWDPVARAWMESL